MKANHILFQLKPHPTNPRVIDDEDFRDLCRSIVKFPQMLRIRGIVHETDGTIIGGLQRWGAIIHLVKKGITIDGVKIKWKLDQVEPAWFINADEAGLTDEQKREFLIKDNAHAGGWDPDILEQEYNQEQLADWGLYMNDWAPAVITGEPLPKKPARAGSTRDGYATFSQIMQPDNKTRLVETLEQVKLQQRLDTAEAALMHLVDLYLKK